jgi:hypothetical protein
MLHILRIIILLKYLGKLQFYTSGEILPNNNIIDNDTLSAGYYLTQTNPTGPTEFYTDYIQEFMRNFNINVDTVCGTLSSPTVTSGEINQAFQNVNNKFLSAELKTYQIDIKFDSNLIEDIALFSPDAITNNTRKLYINVFIF